MIKKDALNTMLAEVTELADDAEWAVNQKRDNIYENMSFFLGKQFRVKNGQYLLDDDYLASGEEMEPRNIIRPIIRAAVAATMRQKINPEMPARSGDQKGRARADNVEKLCKAATSNGIINFDELLRVVEYSKICGLGWMKVCWDPDGGRALETPETGFEFLEEGLDLAETEDPFGAKVQPQVFEGEIHTRFVPILDAHVDPAVRTRADLKKPGTYFVHREYMTLREAEDRWDRDIFGDSTKGRFSTDKGTTGRDEWNAEQSVESDQNTLCEVKWFYQNATRKFPNGRLVVFSGTMMLVAGPNPYKPCRIPFVPLIGDNFRPDSLYADGAIADIKAIQATLNFNASKEKEFVRFSVTPRFLIPKGSGIDPDALDDLPRGLEYQKGYAPEAMQVQQMPQSFFTYGDSLVASAKAISGYGDVSQGEIPPSIQSGRALAYARENEQSMREPDMINFRLFVADIFQHIIYCARQFYDDGRLIKMTGEDGKWELVEFKSDSFDLDNDVVPEIFSGGPQSHALRFSEVTEMFGLGLFDDANPAAKSARRMLGDNYASASTFDPNIEARLKAKRMILQVMKEPFARPLEVFPFDDHEVALDVINRWRRTTEYEELPPEQRALIDEVAELHEMYWAGQNEALAQDQGMINGTGGGMGTPTGPSQPQAESPIDGGHSTYPGQSQDELVANDQSASPAPVS